MNKNLRLNMGNCHHRKYIPMLIELVRTIAAVINPKITREKALREAMNRAEAAMQSSAYGARHRADTAMRIPLAEPVEPGESNTEQAQHAFTQMLKTRLEVQSHSEPRSPCAGSLQALKRADDAGRRTVEMRGSGAHRLPMEAVYRDWAEFRELKLNLEQVNESSSFPPDTWDISR